MGREKRKLPAASGPKERHRRAKKPHIDRSQPVPAGFEARPDVSAIPKSKHHTYLEFVENKDKKKKLEFQITSRRSPPPGFEFVGIGHPELTTACKELSRERDAMIFIVTDASEASPMAQQVHRAGHHFRENIADEARKGIGHMPEPAARSRPNGPEAIPENQLEYHKQVDAAIRDLFPRIPHTDRQMILLHAFTRRPNTRRNTRTEKPVGLAEDITLPRRVQLAVLAHIRHTHTRYDLLLHETSWENARRVVEDLCLDILVKWRGDEETGRDQLDEILREVVIISDSEGDDSDEVITDDTSLEDAEPSRDPDPVTSARPANPPRHRSPKTALPHDSQIGSRQSVPANDPNRTRAVDKKGQRGFKRYRAWEEAIQRNRGEVRLPTPAPGLPFDASGIAPSSNGYVPQQLPPPQNHDLYHQPAPPGTSQYQNAHTQAPPRIPPGQVMYEASARSGFEHNPPDSAVRHTPSPITDRFKDLLVRSIEPGSPEGPPVFGRPLQPWGHGQRYDGRAGTNIHGIHGVGPATGPATLPMEVGSIYRPREVTGDMQPLQRPNDIIVVNAPRPGERSNAIIMEDRGGFYERIPAPQEPSRLPPPGAQAHAARHAESFPQRPQPPHRVVPWEGGSRILHDGRGEPAVEIIPMSEPHRGHETPAFFDLGPVGEPRRVFRGPEPRLVSRGEHVVPRHHPYQEVQRYDGAPVSSSHRPEPVYRQQRHNERPRVDMHGNGERRYGRRPHHPEDVIVLD